MSTSSPQLPDSPDSGPSFIDTFIATGFYSGYIPWASGTFGSLVGLLFSLIPGVGDPLVLTVLIVAGFFAGVFTSGKIAKAEGHKLSKTAQRAKERFQPGNHESPDPSIVVIDEMVGMWIALLFIPKTVLALAIAFLAFRGFDIVKPYPARQVERVPNGWGIMLDDVIAGIYANVATQFVLYLVAVLTPIFFATQ